VMVCQGK